MDITWQSKPDYDEWGWDTYWSCYEWQQWHQTLVVKYGAEAGSELWLQAWYNTDYDTWLIENTDWCGFDSSFVSYFQKYNIDLSNTLSSNIEGIKKLGSGIFSAANILLKVLPWAIVGYVGIKAYTEYQKSKG